MTKDYIALGVVCMSSGDDLRDRIMTSGVDHTIDVRCSRLTKVKVCMTSG